MKTLFVIVAAILCTATIYTWMSQKEEQQRPVIVRTAGRSQDRVEEIAAFHEWMKANGHINKPGHPLFTIKPETARRTIR